MEQFRQMRITVSFSKEYSDIYKYLENTPNKSDYICKALRHSIQQDTRMEDMEDILKNIINKLADEKRMPDHISDNNLQLKKAADSFEF